MKCFVKSLLGITDKKGPQSGAVCSELPPIVKSLVGSAIFLTAMIIVSRQLIG